MLTHVDNDQSNLPVQITASLCRTLCTLLHHRIFPSILGIWLIQCGICHRLNAQQPVVPEAAVPSKSPDTTAEKIASTGQVLGADQTRLIYLEKQLRELEEEFKSASQRFSELDTAMTEQQERLKQLSDSEEKTALAQAIDESKLAWQISRDEFDRIIQQRKAVQKQVETLKAKVISQENWLKQLKSAKTEVVAEHTENSSAKKLQNGAVAPTAAPKSAPKSTTGLPLVDMLVNPAGSADSGASENGGSGNGRSGNGGNEDLSAASSLLKRDDQHLVIDERTLLAASEVDARARSAATAEARVKRLQRTVQIYQNDLESSQQLLEELTKQSVTIDEMINSIDARLAGDISGENRQPLQSQRESLLLRQDRLRQDVAEQRSYFERTAKSLTQVRQAFERANVELKTEREQLADARAELDYLESPLAPHRMRMWLTTRGPKVLLLIAGTLLLWWIIRVSSRHIIHGLVRHSRRGSEIEKENRANTLLRVFHNAVTVALTTLGTLAVLDQSGVNITVLLGGAAVLGAAIAFGAQNLIRDYFSGFMMLLENQYSIGNVVRMANVAGVVEDISLRITALRDEEGIVHFIPHSQIDKVSNMTYGWSRAVLKIAVNYEEDMDRIMEILMDLAREMRDDAEAANAWGTGNARGRRIQQYVCDCQNVVEDAAPTAMGRQAGDATPR